MHCFFIAVAVSALSVFTVSEAKTRLLLEVSRKDITGDEIQEFLSRVIRSANSTTNITASVSDVNECDSFSLNTCSEHAKCTNLVGSYSCECPPTFFDDSEETPGTNCSDIDECLGGTHNCGENSDCVNTIGGFNCSCRLGFTGNGTNCWDIDECADPAIHNCSRDSDCVNNVGSYSCSCKSGFTGDGFSCTTSSTTTEHTTSTTAYATTIATSSAQTTDKTTRTQTRTDTTDTTDTTEEITTTVPSDTTILRSKIKQQTTTNKPIPTTSQHIGDTTRDTTAELTQENTNEMRTDITTSTFSDSTTTSTDSSPAENTTPYERWSITTSSTSTANPSIRTDRLTTQMPDTTDTNVTSTNTQFITISQTNTSEAELTTSDAIIDELVIIDDTTAFFLDNSTAAQFSSSSTTTRKSSVSTRKEFDSTASATSTEMPQNINDTDTSDDVHNTVSTAVSLTSTSESTAIESKTTLSTKSPIKIVSTFPTTTPYTDENSTTVTVISEHSTETSTSMRTESTLADNTSKIITNADLTTSSPSDDATTTHPHATTSQSSTQENVVIKTSPESSTVSIASPTTSSALEDASSTSPTTTNADLTTSSPSDDVTTTHPHATTSQSSTQENVGVKTSSENSTVTIASSMTSSAHRDASSTSPISTETISTDSTSEISTSTVANTSTAATMLSSTTASTVVSSTESDATSSSNIDQSTTDAGTVETTTAAFQTTDIATSETTQATFSARMTSSEALTQTAGFSTSLPNTTTIANEITSTPTPLKPPRYDGNRTKYLDSLQNLLSDLTNDPLQRIDISEASSTIDDFETLILDGGADENLVDITTDVVMAFFGASVENGEVKMTANDSEKITKFVPNLLESMNLATGVYNKIETDLALQALDLNLTVSNSAVFQVTEGSVVLPKEFVESTTIINSSKTQAKDDLRVSFTRYSDSRFFAASNVSFIMSGNAITSATLPAKSSIINSPVIGATVRDRNITDSVQEATIRLNLLVADPLETNFDNGTKEIVSYTANPRCVWWNYESRDWSDSGCVLQGLSNGTVTCKCNHLTSFAVIMTVEKTVEDQILSYLSYIGAGLSIVGLALTILTYSLFRTLRKSRSKRILLHFCIALCGVYITYVLGIAAKLPANQSQCTASGFFMHFFTLSVMAWMSVEVFDMYIMFVKIMQISIHKYLLKASLIAWLTPLVAAIIPLIVHLSSPGTGIYPIYHDGTTVCWLGQTGMLYAFIIPSSIILLANLVLFTIVLRSVTCKRSDGLVGRIGRRSGKNIKASQHVINALALLLLAGPTWIIGYLINVEPVEDGVLRRILSYVFVILNAFQGFWIFIVFCVRPPSVRNKWVNLIRRGKLDDHSRPYFSSSSQRNTTKATSMSPRPSLFPDSSAADETSTASNRRKTAVINTNSSSSSNSNNSNSRVSTHSSTSPLASTSINKQPQKFMPRGSRSLGLDIRIWNGSERFNSISSADTASVAGSELNPTLKM